MSRETEYFFNMFHQYLEDHNVDSDEISEEQFSEYLQKFTAEFNRKQMEQDAVREKNAETVYDYLRLLDEAESPEEALRYAKEVQKLDKDNIDAAMVIADLTSTNSEQRVKKYRNLIKKAEKKLVEDDLWDEDSFGHYWLIAETRPYMRLRFNYAEALAEQGKKRKAIEEYEDMLRLSENDNLGVRYRLMHLYAFYENEVAALRLYQKYDGSRDTMMLLPLIVLYYRLDDNINAKKYLKLLLSANPETKRFFLEMSEEEIEECMINIIEDGGYAIESAEAILATMTENADLYHTTEGFPVWVCENLKKKSK